MTIRPATLLDSAKVAQHERAFCLPLGLPPEPASGFVQFLKAGGFVFLCEQKNIINSAFWLIDVHNFSRIDLRALDPHSPLRTIASNGVHWPLAKGDKFVFSWTCVGFQGAWLIPYLRCRLFLICGNCRLIGYVACHNERAVHNYQRLGGEITARVDSVYEKDDAHFVVEYNLTPASVYAQRSIANERCSKQ